MNCKCKQVMGKLWIVMFNSILKFMFLNMLVMERTMVTHRLMSDYNEGFIIIIIIEKHCLKEL